MSERLYPYTIEKKVREKSEGGSGKEYLRIQRLPIPDTTSQTIFSQEEAKNDAQTPHIIMYDEPIALCAHFDDPTWSQAFLPREV